MSILNVYDGLTARLRSAGDYVWPTLLRLILAWEFWESGITKLRGENWFASIPWADWQKGFPFPFDKLSPDLNWFFATWGELVFAVMVLLGLFTRFTALSLIVITAVATAAVHWPAEWDGLTGLWTGYAITAKGSAGNFKLPILFILMLLPLVFHGGGKLSLDQLLLKLGGRDGATGDRVGDWYAASLALAILGFSVLWLEATWGAVFFIAAIVAALATRISR